MKKRMKAAARFVVCVKNKGYEASLEIGKLYRVLPDKEAQGHGYLRIVDESGRRRNGSPNKRLERSGVTALLNLSPSSAGRSATKRSARFASSGAASDPRRRAACRQTG